MFCEHYFRELPLIYSKVIELHSTKDHVALLFVIKVDVMVFGLMFETLQYIKELGCEPLY